MIETIPLIDDHGRPWNATTHTLAISTREGTVFATTTAVTWHRWMCSCGAAGHEYRSRSTALQIGQSVHEETR